jgi:hypothetical protein
VSDLVGAGRGKRAPEERLTHRNGYRARPWATRGTSSSCRSQRYFAAATSDFLERRWRSEQALVRSCRRRTVPASRLARSTRWSSRSVAESRRARCADLPGARRAGRRLSQPAARGPLPLSVVRCQGREGPRPPSLAQGAGAGPPRARVRPPRGDRPRRQRSGDGGPSGAASCARWPSAASPVWSSLSPTPRWLKKAIAQVLGCPGCAAPSTSCAKRSGHARRGQHSMLAAPLSQLFNGDSKAARELVGDAFKGLRTPLPNVAALLEEGRTTCSPSTASRPTTGRSCARPTHSSASTARSEAAPASSASSPTTAR